MGQGGARRQHQGGVISPLLLNVALHGMEQALGSYYTPRGTFRGTYALVRYADDVAIFCPTHAEAMEAKTLLAPWLASRGLRWSEAKTHIRHAAGHIGSHCGMRELHLRISLDLLALDSMLRQQIIEQYAGA